MIYFELLDTNILPTIDTVPRIHLWSTEIVKKIECCDSLGIHSSNYGRLPLKDINSTPFRRRLLNPEPTFELPQEFEQLLLSYSGYHNHHKMKAQLLLKAMHQDVLTAIQLVLAKYLANIANMLLSDSITTGPHDGVQSFKHGNKMSKQEDCHVDVGDNDKGIQHHQGLLQEDISNHANTDGRRYKTSSRLHLKYMMFQQYPVFNSILEWWKKKLLSTSSATYHIQKR
ncbi:hypothetical protein E2562_037417, partial [Oryza meyeriana var. granulata]